MKRHRARLDPVSCQFCRSKKLKCNRVQPCANCLARGVDCLFSVPPPKHQTSPASDINHDLLQRVERLESLVLPHHAEGDTATRQQLVDSNVSTTSSPRTHKADGDVHLLENLGIRDNALLPGLSRPIRFQIRDTIEIQRLQTAWQSDNKPPEVSQHVSISFPSYRVATLLLDNYKRNVDHVCRVLHLPTTSSIVESLYLDLAQGKPIVQSQAGVLLSLFALSSFFYPPSESFDGGRIEGDTMHLCKYWARSALDVLDHLRRDTSGTLDDVQAYILMSYVTYHLDGFSARGRLLSATAASLARDLGLQWLDLEESPQNQEPRFVVDREVKRRVFWHIASTDWLHSTMSGPQEGTYTVQVSQYCVNLPQNCNDEAIGLSNSKSVTDRPTSMSFFLSRIQLAHICREITDAMPLGARSTVSYGVVIDMDRKLEDFTSSLPFFFRMDEDCLEKTRPLETVYPRIPIMRYCILTAAHSRRCRLHQRFLLRQSEDPQYASSRQACLQSASAILQLYRPQQSPKSPTEMAQMGIAMHYTHMALAVMVMDLCFNTAPDQAVVESQVEETFQYLAEAMEISPLLRKSAGALKDMLRRHCAWRGQAVMKSVNHEEAGALQELEMHDPGAWLGPFQNMWESVGDDLDLADWDNLFTSLDSRPF